MPRTPALARQKSKRTSSAHQPTFSAPGRDGRASSRKAGSAMPLARTADDRPARAKPTLVDERPIDSSPVTLSELESHLWEAANILRGSPVDRADWKSYILPLLF